MKPKRCCQGKKETKKRSNDDNINEIMEHKSKSDSFLTSSPKKRRESKDHAQVHPTPQALPLPPVKEDLETPPILPHHITSPPRLEQRYFLRSEGWSTTDQMLHLSLPELPSDLINDTHSSRSIPRFKLNPRIEWNRNVISRQIRSSERPLSSYLNESSTVEHEENSPVCPPLILTNFLDDYQGVECTTTTIKEIIKPIPRYESKAFSSGGIATEQNDDPTFLHAMREGCAWFNPSWASAFDPVEKQNQNDGNHDNN